MTQNYKLQLTLNPNQARLLEKILDLYTRIGIGHFEVLSDEINKLFKVNAYNLDTQDNLAYELLMVLKRQVAGCTRGHYGIASPEVDNQVKTCYDIQKVIQKGIHTAEEMPDNNIWSDGDILHLGTEPSAEVSVLKNNISTPVPPVRKRILES